MPEVTGYEAGAPCWGELTSPDTEASKAFYGGLFGWDSYTITHPSFGDYDVFTVGGVTGPEVAGLTALADDTLRPTWTCYFSVTDAVETAEAVRMAGGQVQTEPVDFGHLGRLAICVDTQGAGFGLWQPHEVFGSRLVDEPGTMCWVQLDCRDPEAAKRFYGDVFGWKAFTADYVAAYTEWKIADRSVAGMERHDELRVDTAAHWAPHFAVADCDASVARAVELGGEMWVPPTTIPPGRFAVVSDPAGAEVVVFRPAGPSFTRTVSGGGTDPSGT